MDLCLRSMYFGILVIKVHIFFLFLFYIFFSNRGVNLLHRHKYATGTHTFSFHSPTFLSGFLNS